MDILKLKPNLIFRILKLCLMFLSIITAYAVHANSCRTYFPSPLSSSNLASSVSFATEVQVTGTDGSIAIGIGSDSTYSPILSCVSQKCTDSNQRTPAISLPTFETRTSSDNRTIKNNRTEFLPQGTYQNIELGFRSKLHLTSNNQITYIDNLNASQSQSEITFEQGTYWINNLTTGFESKINVSGNDKVVVYVNNASFSQSSLEFNELGLPEQLVLVLYQPTTFGYRAIFNGFIFSADRVVIGNENQINGAIHGNNISLNYQSVLNFAKSSIDNLDIDSFCSSQEPPLPDPAVDLRFDRTYWTDATNEVLDSSTNQIHGTINDDVAVFESGQICRAATFDGTNDYVHAPGIENYLRNTATLIFWLKTTQVGNNTAWFAPGIIGNEHRGGADDIFWGIIDASGRIGFQKGNGRQVKSTDPINDDSWHQVAFTWDEQTGEAKVYINGTLNQTATTETGAVTRNFSSIGRIVDSFGSVQFTGQLDEFSVYDQILTADEIKRIYDQQALGKNPDGSNRVCPIEAQAGQVTLNDTSINPQFTKVCFDREFSVPPKVFTIGQTNNDDRLTLRIKNVTTQGFEIAQVESEERAAPANEQPAGNISQTIDFLAIVEGDHYLDNGKLLRVATHNTTTYQGRLAGGVRTWDQISIADLALTDTPVVMTTIQTLNNETNPIPFSEPFMATTMRNLNSQRFDLALERGETRDGVIANAESIAYLVTNANNSGQLNRDIQFESFLVERYFNGIGDNRCNTYRFDRSYGDTLPLVLASQNSRFGGDGGWLARCSLSSTEVGFSVIEDRDNDSDNSHIPETASGLILSGNFTNQTCGGVPQDIHHYRIEHDGQGLTCDSEPVNVKACLDANCNTLSSRSTSAELTLDGASKSLFTFTGSTVLTFEHNVAETGTLDLINASVAAINPVKCDTGSGSSCDITFKDAGFRFLDATNNSTIINNQIAGIPFPEGIKIQAVENDSGVCKGIFNSDQRVQLAQENVNPGGSSGLYFEVSGNQIAKYVNNNTTEISLSFDSDSSAILPNALYSDAGQIRIRAFYDSNNIQLEGTSSSFWVAPANLVLSAEKSGVILNGADANSSVTQAAGDVFDFQIQAMNGASPAQITQNYQPGQIQLSVQRVLPNHIGSVDGQLTYTNNGAINSTLNPLFQNVNISSFISGIYSYNNARFSEVGVLQVDVRDSNYANTGMTIDGDVIALGRFTPAYLSQQVEEMGSLLATCDGRIGLSAFSGQKQENNASVGAISYLSNPVLKITAYSAQGTITQNYHQDSQGSNNDFMKLDASHINIVSPSNDMLATGVDGSLLPLVSTISSGTLSQDDLTAVVITPLARGVLHYKLSSNDHFYYVRSANSKVDPFESRLQFNLTNSFDSDNVPILNTQPFTPTGIDIRFGRINLENTFGPETHNMAVNMSLEHYENARFVKSFDNSCPSVLTNNFSLATMSLDASLTELAGNTNHFLDGAISGLHLKAPGENNTGNMSISYDSFDWLQYDWANTGSLDQNPSAEATFGIYKGDQRLLHWREVQ